MDDRTLAGVVLLVFFLAGILTITGLMLYVGMLRRKVDELRLVIRGIRDTTQDIIDEKWM